MNSKEKGDLSVIAAINFYGSLGYEILLPIGDKQKYDLVVDTGEKLLKVQCKYCGHKPKNSPSYHAPLRVMGGNQSFHTIKRYQSNDFDIYFVMTREGAIYAIPAEIVLKNTNEIALSKKMDKYKVN